MAWIETHQSLNNHPKLKKAARLAGIEQVAMIGYLLRLWWWCLDYAPKGDVSIYDPDDIESAVDWSGERGLLWTAWCQVGFIDDNEIHDWYDYAGKLLDKRRTDAQRKREGRKASNGHPADIAAPSNGHPMSGAGTDRPTVPTVPTDRTAHDSEQENASPVPSSVESGLSLAVKAYESHIGIISYSVGEDLKELSATYPPAWLPRAIELAKGKRSPMPYIRSCLRNWQNGDGEPPANGAIPKQKQKLIPYEEPKP